MKVNAKSVGIAEFIAQKPHKPQKAGKAMAKAKEFIIMPPPLSSSSSSSYP